MFLISLVSLLAVVYCASAHKWAPPDCVNEYNWYTPDAWDDGGTPATAPFDGVAQIEMDLAGCPAYGPLIDSDVTVENAQPSLDGPARSGTGTQTMRIIAGTVNIGDRWYCNNSNSNGTAVVTVTGTAVVNSLSGSSKSMRCGDGGGHSQITVSGSGQIHVGGGWRNADGSLTAVLEHTFTDNAVVTAKEYFRFGDDGHGTLHMLGSSSTTITAGKMQFNGRKGGTSYFYVADDAELYTDGDFDIVSSAPGIGFLDVSGGTMNVEDMKVAGGGASGGGTLTITGGLINVRDDLECPDNTDGCTADVHLDGGTIQVADELNLQTNGSIDITGGTLIVNGNILTKINQLILDGLLTGYGSDRTLVYDYNVRNPGKTTMWL
jgi:hypothetical protein